MLPGARKDPQLITSSWSKLRPHIDGVTVREVLHVPGNRGVLTEMFRPEWDPGGEGIAQVFQVRLVPGALSAWHCHARAVDRLFVAAGLAKVVLYDAREESPTHRTLVEIDTGESRPCLIVVPPRVWHGVRNSGGGDALLLNFPSHAYDYEDPDHYRLSADSKEIPYVWPGLGT